MQLLTRPRKKHASEPSSKKPPAVYWHEKAKQFVASIGYRFAKKGPHQGKRVRSVWYFGRDYRQATFDAINKAREWEAVVDECKAWKQKCLDNGCPVPEESALPVWETDKGHRLEPTPQGLADKGLLWECPPDEGEEHDIAIIPLHMVRDQFVEAMTARVGLVGKRGLKSQTLTTMTRILDLSLKGIDKRKNLLDLSRQDCTQFIHYWSSPDRKLAVRSIGNYCKLFKRMIDWASNESIGGYTKPKMDDLFEFANPKGKNVRFDPERLKLMLSNATDRCRLYVILALNTGYTQIDVSDIRTHQIIQVGGDYYLTRQREKTTHQNDFQTQHFLWPETMQLLNEQMAPINSNQRVLLNVNGGHLLRGKTDNIRDSINHARTVSGVKEITYKQLRKIGVTAIKRITSNSDVARMYASHKIYGVLGNYDRDDCFEPLTQALKKWREELITQGVLTTYCDRSSKATEPQHQAAAMLRPPM